MVISSPPSTMSKTGEICLKPQIFHYYPLTDWLLGATIGNYGYLVMDFQWLQTLLHQQ